MRLDLSLDGERVELGFNCDDEGAADMLFERLQIMIATGAIVLQLSTVSGEPIALENVDA